jgi:hypothetical protein
MVGRTGGAGTQLFPLEVRSQKQIDHSGGGGYMNKLRQLDTYGQSLWWGNASFSPMFHSE